MYLSRTAKSVTIVCRRTLEDSMSYYLIQQIRANDKIKEMPNTVVHAVGGDGHLERICLENTQTGERIEANCGRMFIFIGAQPRTDWLDGVRRPRRPRLHPGRARICATCADGRWKDPLTIWKQVCPVCLLQVMYVPNPPSGWRPLSAKARWR